MKYFLAALLVSVLPGPVQAAELRVFFSQTGLSDEANPNSPIAGSPALANPVVDVTGSSQRLYVWAQMLGSPATQTWYRVSLDFRATGGLRIKDRTFWNYSIGGPRWDGVSQGTIVSSGTELVGVALAADTARGVNNTPTTQTADGQYDPGTNSTLIGSLIVEGSGELFVGVGVHGIARLAAAGPETIHFGFGDENDPIDGDDIGSYSTLADARTEVRLDVEDGVGHGAILRCSPNPSAVSRVRMLYGGPRDTGAVLLSIWDLEGRLIARLPLHRPSIDWDCRDRLGRPVPPGVYLVGIHTGGKLLGSERLVLVR